MAQQIVAARDLSPDEAEERAAHCFELHERVTSALRKGREATWEAAQALYEFDEAHGWTAIGGYDTLSEWLADPEVGITSSVYYRAVGAWRELIVTRQVEYAVLAELDVSKVDIVLPAIKKGKVTTEEALSDAKVLGFRDLRDQYVARPKPALEEPEPDAESVSSTVTIPDEVTATSAAELDEAVTAETHDFDVPELEVRTHEPTVIDGAQVIVAPEEEPDEQIAAVDAELAVEELAETQRELEIARAEVAKLTEELAEAEQTRPLSPVDVTSAADVEPDPEFTAITIRVSTDEMNKALGDWQDLRFALKEAASSGQTNPRVSTRLIARGLVAIDWLLEEGGIELV